MRGAIQTCIVGALLWVASATLLLGSAGFAAPATTPFRVVVAQAEDAAHFDPPVDWNTAPEWVEMNAYDCLLFKSPDAGRFIPKLAVGWRQINPTTMRFSLRRGVTFQNGSPFTAEDVKFHYERIKQGRREQYIVVDQYQFFSEIVVRDAHTVDFVTPAPDSFLLYEVSQTGCGIVSKKFFQAVGSRGMLRRPMGTGPYRLKDWSRGEQVVFQANPTYWAGEPAVDEFVFRIIPEPSTRLAELLTGGVDVTYGLHAKDEARIKANPRLRAVWSPTDRGWMLYTRHKANERFKGDRERDRKFATEDPRVREAIELAIDKYALRNLVAATGEAFRARMFQPLQEANPSLWGQAANPFNPDRAREILREAGYRPGEPRLVFDVADTFPDNDIARAITQMLQRVGFTVDLRLKDFNTFLNDIFFPAGSQELMLTHVGGNLNPFFALRSFTVARGRGYGHGNPDLDQVIQCAASEVRDARRRLECFHRANQEIADQRYVIGLFQVVQLWGINNRVDYTPRSDNFIFGAEMKPRR